MKRRIKQSMPVNWLCFTLALISLASFSHKPMRCEEPTTHLKFDVKRILFLGNSITLHAPAPQIGWTGNWGMAASSKEKDYVHLLVERISKSTGNKPVVMIKNIADFERQLEGYNIQEQLKEELAFQADVIILAIGENCQSPSSDETRQHFSAAMKQLLTQLQKHGDPKIFVRSQFWPDATKDALLKLAADEHKAIWVDLGQLGTDQRNFALSERAIEHLGVGRHPGDQGMLAIANHIWAAMEQHSLAIP